jgi:hypothetical protein
VRQQCRILRTWCRESSKKTKCAIFLANHYTNMERPVNL